MKIIYVKDLTDVYSGYILNIVKNVLYHYDTHYSYREIDGRYKLKLKEVK